MSSTSGHSVELAEGNDTLYALLAATLEEEGFEVRDFPSEQLADLLVADVDSDLEEFEERFDEYLESSRAILVCGVRSSREEYDGETWLGRPFEPAEFVASCRRALGLEEEDSFAKLGEEESDDDSTTREVSYESADVDPEGDDGSSERAELEEGGTEGEVLEIDDASSMVLDVQEVRELEGGYGSGGEFAEGVAREGLDVGELEEEAEGLELSEALSDPDANPSLPEVPDYDEDGPEGAPPEESSSIRQVDSDPGRTSGAGTTGSRRKPTAGSGPVEPDSVVGAQVPAGEGSPPARGGERVAPPGGPDAEWPQSSGHGIPPDFERELAEVASLLAQSWGRLGLTARWEDRGERLKRIFSALVSGGLDGASEELERIPPAHGFTGVLDVFPPFELVCLIRRRGFLGRLEVSNESGGYVLYIDANRLVGIDDLEGRSEAMLLDCLRESASVDEELYSQLRNTVEDSLAAPLEMRLRTEQLVTEEQLLDARRIRAKWVVKEVLNARTGNFAFIHGGDESGQPWPVNELGLSVDVLLLELLRDGAVEWRERSAEETEAFVTAGHRLGDEQQTALALAERDVLHACRTPASLDRITREVDGGRAEIAAVVQRLLAVGFLQPTTIPETTGSRSGPHRAAGSGGSESVGATSGGSDAVTPTRSSGPQEPVDAPEESRTEASEDDAGATDERDVGAASEDGETT